VLLAKIETRMRPLLFPSTKLVSYKSSLKKSNRTSYRS